ncbi:hypothetical protein Gohar_019135, partial [Gossypium harknessii]|nr:hypothetical protein [Gossypium harknessii]
IEQIVCKSRTKNSWQRLEPRWVNINIDGSTLMSRQRAAIGGALRGLSRGCLVGFEMVTSMADIFQIEV